MNLNCPCGIKNQHFRRENLRNYISPPDIFFVNPRKMFIFYLTRIVGGIGIQRGSHTSAAGLVLPGMFLEGLEISE